MALFKIPKRTETSIDNILTKVATEEAPKIKLKGTSLLSKIDMIRQTVEKNLGSEKGNYFLIDNDSDWINYCTKACNSDYVAYDTECDSLDTMKAKLAGICIKATDMPSAYVTVGHISPITEKPLPNQVSMSAISSGLEMLVKSGAKFLMHNSYFDVVLTYQQTGVMLPVYFDTLVCAELLNENEQHGLKYLYAKYCKQSDNFHKFAELFDGIPINLIPPEIAGIYGQFDAIMTYDLALWQMPYVTHGTPECNRYKLDGVADLFWNIDMKMIEVLVSMRLEGLEFDFEKAKELKIKYSKLRDEAEQNFNKAVEKYKNEILEYISNHNNTQLEYPINYNSPVQLKILFYEIAKIPKGLYRKQPEGTGKDVINAILNTTTLKNTPIYDVVKHLSDVKMYDKAISSFIDKLSADAKEHDGKIHCSFSLVNTDCIVGSSLIPTSGGYFTIKDIVENHIDSVTIINKDCEYEKTSQYVKFEDCPTIKLDMAYGYTIEGTPNHPILNDNLEFVELQNIKKGDYIYLPLGYNLFPKEYVPLNKNNGRRLYGKSKVLWENTPTVINEDVALLLGMYHADGSINTSNESYRINIENHDVVAIENIKNAYFSVFGVLPEHDTSYNKRWNMNRSGLFVSGVGISWLDNYIKRGSKNKCIPNEIKVSPRSVILSYIKGMTLDSTFACNKLMLSVIKYEDALFIQSVLANIGILSGISVHNAPRYVGYRITIGYEDYNKFMADVGACYDYPETVPDRKCHFGIIKKGDKVFIKVKNITYGQADVYDFKVPGTHSFISNSIVSHNTGRLAAKNPRCWAHVA